MVFWYFFTALSCPPVRVYSSDKLDVQLQTAAASFCGQEVEVVAGEQGGPGEHFLAACNVMTNVN